MVKLYITLGYDISSINMNNELDGIVKDTENIPDIILVKKKYAKKSKRIWKLKHMDIEKEEAVNKKDLKNQIDYENQYEEFMKDLEEDKDLRKAAHLYRDDTAIKELEGKLDKMNIEEDDDNEVKIDELLDELTINDTDVVKKDPEPLGKEEDVNTYRPLRKKAKRDGTPEDDDDE
jgi:nonsense-mediated mRNA decay protein 3